MVQIRSGRANRFRKLAGRGSTRAFSSRIDPAAAFLSQEILQPRLWNAWTPAQQAQPPCRNQRGPSAYRPKFSPWIPRRLQPGAVPAYGAIAAPRWGLRAREPYFNTISVG